MSERIGVGVRGAGTVGGGVIRELLLHGEEWGLELRGVAVDDPNKKGREFEGPLYTDSKGLLSDDRIRIVVEAPGGVTPKDSRDFMLEAINSGRSIVTPAKAPIALFAPQLFDAARSRSVDIQFEGTVAGGVPIVNPMRDRARVDRVEKIMGIVNGTTNHMLSEMEKAVLKKKKRGANYRSVLNQAIAAGYAEADPTSDVEGEDAAYKLAILFMLGFNSWTDPRNIDRRGITDISPVDLDFANDFFQEGFNHTIKLLAIADKIRDDLVELRVTPALVRRDHQLANIGGVFNAVRVGWELAGPQMFTGRGAGRDATTSAVVEDLRTAAENLERGPDNLPALNQSFRIREPQDVVRGGYVRMYLKDVEMSAGIAYTILGQNHLDLQHISQRGEFTKTVKGERYAADIVTFRPTQQENVDAALADLRKSDRVIERPIFIPFEGQLIAA